MQHYRDHVADLKRGSDFYNSLKDEILAAVRAIARPLHQAVVFRYAAGRAQHPSEQALRIKRWSWGSTETRPRLEWLIEYMPNGTISCMLSTPAQDYPMGQRPIIAVGIPRDGKPAIAYGQGRADVALAREWTSTFIECVFREFPEVRGHVEDLICKAIELEANEQAN